MKAVEVMDKPEATEGGATILVSDGKEGLRNMVRNSKPVFLKLRLNSPYGSKLTAEEANHLIQFYLETAHYAFNA